MKVKQSYKKSSAKRTPKTATAGKAQNGADRRPGSKTYHHGGLRDAFLKAAETVLLREGVGGLTVRAISREAKVSHTAAKHHFSDRTGIFSELAAVGHLRLSATLAAHAQNLPAGRERRRAIARGYIAFASNNPDLFRLMSRNELLEYTHPVLQDALRISSRALAGVFDVHAEVKQDLFTTVTKDEAIAIAAAWGFVHGMANLLIDGRLNRLSGAVVPPLAPEELVDLTLNTVSLQFSINQQSGC